MKILYVINNMGLGGAEKLVQTLVPVLNKNAFIDIDLLLLSNEREELICSLNKENLKVMTIKYNSMYDPRNIFEIKKCIDENHYDIVHAHLFPTQYWTSIARFFLQNKSVKFVTTEHSSFNRRRKYKFFKFLDKFIYRNYDKIISIERSTQEALIDWLSPSLNEQEKYCIIENGVDLVEVQKATTLPLFENKKEKKYICMVGRFDDPKDQKTIIKSLEYLDDCIELILVGDGPLILESKQLAQRMDLEDRVHFLGFRSDVYNIIKSVDINILSTKWEGLSLASIEKLASGKPLIASAVTGIKEVVEGAGLLFEYGNEKDLAFKIKDLIENPKIYDEVSLKCIERANKFSINETEKELLEVYKGLSGGIKYE